MSLSDNAREALAHIKSEFETEAASYPKLRHVLIETPDVEAFNEAQREACFVLRGSKGNNREVMQLWRERAEFHVFIDDEDFWRGRKAYDAFRKLAASVVKVLADQKLLEYAESPPDDSELWLCEQRPNHFAKEWMRFIHQHAKNNPGAWPESESTTYLEHRQLRKGGTVNTLTPDVFTSSSIVIGRILSEDLENAQPKALSHNPQVLRGPHGFTFTSSPTTLPASQEPEDFSKRPEWIAWVEQNLRNDQRMAEARRVDPMPDPEKINVGELIDFLTLIARTPQDWLAVPEVGQAILRRDRVLSASPGWKAFEAWRDVEHHRKTAFEAAKELLALLVERLRRPSEELRLMPLLDAVRLISETATVSPPADQPSASVAQPPCLNTATNASELIFQNYAAQAPNDRWLVTTVETFNKQLRPAGDASGEKTPEAPAINYDALANELAKHSKPKQAALVRFMKDKTSEGVQEIAEKVHGNAYVSEEAIAKNARETTASLVALGSRLSFRVAGGMMHKEISPK
jgi:hypothetical protein